MFTTINAKFPGTCKRCGRQYEAGARIRFGGRGRTYHLSADCPAGKGGSTPGQDYKSRAANDDSGDPFGLDRAVEDQAAYLTREI